MTDPRELLHSNKEEQLICHGNGMYQKVVYVPLEIAEQALEMLRECSAIRELQKEVHRNALDHGFWDEDNPSLPEKLALIHSEVSEALEDYRNGRMHPDSLFNKPVGFPSELADVVIRCLDLAEYLDIDLEAEILAKHKYNQSRPFKHGKVC